MPSDTTSDLLDVVHPSWLPVLEPLTADLTSVADFLASEQQQGHLVLPARQHIFRALATSASQPRVVILGQDPYPTPGHSIGLAFAVDRKTRPLPRSLVNIYRELHDDLGIPIPAHGDLSTWQNQGVMLLNRCLSVRAGQAGSHRSRGWENITAAILAHLSARPQPLVAILWGKDAQATAQYLPGVPIISSPHPSPLSAHRGFFGSRPFSRCNSLLGELGVGPIDWQISS